MKPIGVLLCGPSGVGKTSHTAQMLKNAGADISDFLVVDPDKIDLPSHEEQSAEALHKLRTAVTEKKHVIYIATCRGIRYDLKDILKSMKKNGYRTVVGIVYTSLPVALQRIQLRTDQPTPDEVVNKLHDFFKRKAEYFMNAPDIDEIYLYNNQTDFNLVLEKKKKKIQCFAPDSDFYFDVSKYC
jgi:tRNA uridine 5-carbamoylmethylation protein Kti12